MGITLAGLLCAALAVNILAVLVGIYIVLKGE